MKSVDKFDLYDEVIVEGKDGIFTVEAYFEQLLISNGRQTFELWYTVRDKKFGGVSEARYNLVSSAANKKKENMNDMLDEHNDYLRLETMLNDPEYGTKAKYILEKMKYEK